MHAPLARRAVLFGIDGGGTFFERAHTPNIDAIFQNGAISRKTLTEIPTVSAECWGAMLHGVDCHRHLLTNWIADHAPYPENSPYPTVFRAIRAHSPQAKMASFCDWDCINKGIIEKNLGVFQYNDKDFCLIEPAIEYIQNNDFTLLFFQFDSVDHMGHKHGYGSPEHIGMIEKNDEFIGRVVRAIQEKWGLEDALLLVEADHGGTPGGDHGGDSDAEKYVFFAAAGPGVRRAEIRDMLVRDTSPAILYALGIPQPDSWNGRIPDGLFENCPSMPRPEGLPLPKTNRRRETAAEEGGFLGEFGAMNPRLYLPFEGVCTPESAPRDLEAHGKLYRIAGVRGKALRFDDGWLSMRCPDVSEGFTVTCWVRLESAVLPSVLVANRSSDRENDRVSPGFSIGFGGRYLHIKLKDASEDKPLQITLPQPEDILEGWMFLAVAVDPARRFARVSTDFGPFFTCPLSENSRLLLQNEVLCVGQDPVQACPHRLPAALDDFCLFGEVLDDAALEKLKAYYC